MTTLFVGDIHLKSARVLPAVDRAVAMTGADGVVFLGDVCDDWDVTAREAVAAVRMFADWVRARRARRARCDGIDGQPRPAVPGPPALARIPLVPPRGGRLQTARPRGHPRRARGVGWRGWAWRCGRVLATHAA